MVASAEYMGVAVLPRKRLLPPSLRPAADAQFALEGLF